MMGDTNVVGCVASEACPHNTGRDRGITVTERVALMDLGKASSEKQIPQVVENLESGGNQKESLEPVTLRVKQAL